MKAARSVVPTLVLTISVGMGLLVAGTAWADSGLPMLVLIWPAFWLLLAPIVLVEAFVATRQLGMPMRRALVASLVANAISTLGGAPLTWGVLALVEILCGGGLALGPSNPLITRVLAVTAQAPWLMPYENELYWMVPTAAAVLLVPFFFMSVFLEEFVMRHFVSDRPSTKRWSRRANAITYAGMMAIAVVWLIVAVVRGK